MDRATTAIVELTWLPGFGAQHVSRDRISLDLRGLGSALRTRAQVRGTTVAHAAREILAAELCRLDPSRETPDAGGGDTSRETVKVTIRLFAADARELRRRARAAGDSYGEYVRTLIRGAPSSEFPDRKQLLERLRSSTDQLAAAFADVNRLKRLLSGSESASTQAFVGSLETLAQEVRGHLALASSVILEFKPQVIRGTRTSRQQGDRHPTP